MLVTSWMMMHQANLLSLGAFLQLVHLVTTLISLMNQLIMSMTLFGPKPLKIQSTKLQLRKKFLGLCHRCYYFSHFFSLYHSAVAFSCHLVNKTLHDGLMNPLDNKNNDLLANKNINHIVIPTMVYSEQDHACVVVIPNVFTQEQS